MWYVYYKPNDSFSKEIDLYRAQKKDAWQKHQIHG